MNTLCVIIACVAGGPFSAAIVQASPAPEGEWMQVSVAEVVIELPTLTPQEYTRTAPANYRMPMPTKAVPRWCGARPTRLHGYNCGMQRAVEDLLGHLQTVHGVPLEEANQLGREHWQDLHDDHHWCDESESRQQLFLTPKPKPTCITGTCPTGGG